MLSFFEQIWDVIQSALSLVVQLVKGLFQAFMFIPQIIASLTESIGYLPGVLAIFATLGVTFMIINYIIGRQGS